MTVRRSQSIRSQTVNLETDGQIIYHNFTGMSVKQMTVF